LQPYRRFGEQPHQQHLAALDRLVPQVIAVKFDQVEGVKERAPVIAPVAQPIETWVFACCASARAPRRERCGAGR
jgi:hypothetical protein